MSKTLKSDCRKSATGAFGIARDHAYIHQAGGDADDGLSGRHQREGQDPIQCPHIPVDAKITARVPHLPATHAANATP